MTQTHYPQFCALARAAEIIGERWTLLIVRELLLGPKRFGDLVERLSGVSPTVLTGRLNALIESGIVQRATLAAPFNAQTYELTPVGLALKPAIRELIRWGGHFLFPPRPDDTFEPDWVLLGLDAIARQTPTPARTIALRVTQGGKSAGFLVRGGPQGTTLDRGDGPASATIETRFDTLLRILSTQLPLEQAVSQKLVRVEGSGVAARSLPRMLLISAIVLRVCTGRTPTTASRQRARCRSAAQGSRRPCSRESRWRSPRSSTAKPSRRRRRGAPPAAQAGTHRRRRAPTCGRNSRRPTPGNRRNGRSKR